MNDDTKPASMKRPGSEPRPSLPKRFYQAVTVEPADDGARFAVQLDGRGVRTPSKRVLAAPTRALAAAVADEWRGQGATIDPATMPLTRLLNTAIDGVTGREAEVRADIVEFAGSDLLCYFAPEPVALAERQAKLWGAIHQWAADDLGVRLNRAEGVMPVAQDPAMLERIAQLLAPYDAHALTSLHVMTTLTGSALLSLACVRGRLTGAQAWALAHIDEDYQIEHWGPDADAAARRQHRWVDMDAADRLLSLLDLGSN